MKTSSKDTSASEPKLIDSDECCANSSRHYHLEERNTSGLNIMSGIKSLVCDLNGIVIAEMVYRCMICDVIYETIPDVQIHYQTKHIDSEVTPSSPKPKLTTATNVSFFDSLILESDRMVDTPEPPITPTLTFDVPSGLKTLHQQFGTSEQKQSPNKKKNTKPLISGESKSKNNLNHKSKVSTQTTPHTYKSGFITCEICGATKFYKYTQRRFGVYSCVGCAKFYSKYLLKPTAYMCENLGKCNLKLSECEPNGRCKACLVHKCKSKFVIDPKKLQMTTNGAKLNSLLPIKKNKNGLNTSKPKVKHVVSKDSHQSRPVNTSNPTKTKTKETDANIKVKTETTTNFKSKVKTDKPKVKISDKAIAANKKSPNSLSKGSISKSVVSSKVKKNGLKDSQIKSNAKRIRNQTSCQKCCGFKKKSCIRCKSGTSLRERNKIGHKVKGNRILTRTRNK